MTKANKLECILNNLFQQVDDIRGALLIKRNGLLVQINDSLDKKKAEKIAAQSSVVLEASKRFKTNRLSGKLENVFTSGPSGDTLVFPIKEDYALIAVTGVDPMLGMVLLECQSSVKELEDVL